MVLFTENVCVQNKISPAPEKTGVSAAEGGAGAGHAEPDVHPDPPHQAGGAHGAGQPKQTNQR